MSKQDKLLAAYLRADRRLKRATECKELLRQKILSNPADSTRFSVTITESVSDRVESLRAIKDKSRSLYNALYEAGAVKQVVAKRITVKEKI